MKKLLTILALSITLVTLVACGSKDEIAPLIFIESENLNVIVNQNEELDFEKRLLVGVSAVDDLDGDITDKIKVIYDEVDLTTPGEYKAEFFVSDKAGNQALPASKKVIVLKVYELITPYPIHNGDILGEVAKPPAQNLFGGAFYHKVQSSRDAWIGLEGTVTLPEVKITRYLDGKNNPSLDLDPSVKNLDNPSIYMGGTGSYESDVGLSLSNTLLADGSTSVGGYAFRPFWRYITNPNSKNKDIGGYDLLNGRRYTVSANHGNTNMAGNWHFSDTQYYYLPGDKIRMIVYSPEVNRLQLQIEVIEVSTLADSVKKRKDNNWKNPEDFVSPLFESEGHGTAKTNAVFKRVNAIDQSGNEGGTAIPTNTEITNAVWESVYLHRNINNKIMRVPFIDRRLSVLSAPEAKYFTVSEINNLTGGQKVSIHPGKK